MTNKEMLENAYEALEWSCEFSYLGLAKLRTLINEIEELERKAWQYDDLSR